MDVVHNSAMDVVDFLLAEPTFAWCVFMSLRAILRSFLLVKDTPSSMVFLFEFWWSRWVRVYPF
jgi:hypothetical protein